MSQIFRNDSKGSAELCVRSRVFEKGGAYLQDAGACLERETVEAPIEVF